MAVRETKMRSVIKAVSYRALGSLATAGIAYLLTGKTGVALTIGGADAVIKIVLFFVHERFWNHIQFGQQEVVPGVIWLTGLSGAGKTTLARELVARIRKRGYRVEHLDGDEIRSLFPNTGFSREDRDAHIRRVGVLASWLERNGVVVVASLISPYKESRDFVRGICKNFFEVHVTTPIEVCARRDPKGLYAKQSRGEMKGLTGIDQPYEAPERPEVIIDTQNATPEQTAEQLLQRIREKSGSELEWIT